MTYYISKTVDKSFDAVIAQHQIGGGQLASVADSRNRLPPQFDGPGGVWSPETLLCASRSGTWLPDRELGSQELSKAVSMASSSLALIGLIATRK